MDDRPSIASPVAIAPQPPLALEGRSVHWSLAALLVLALAACGGEPKPAPDSPQRVEGSPPASGGRLVVALGADPQTLNPVIARDRSSREVTWRMTADLVHTNRISLESESALAESWSQSEDGRSFVLELRRNVRFSDGEPFDADDVVFSFRVAQDAAVGSSNHDLLVLDGEPIQVRKLGTHAVEFELPRPHAVGDRIFDSVPILPRHLLEESYETGLLAEAWRLDTAPDRIAGLGPFRLKSYVPADRLVLERNPYYWKTDEHGTPLPYLEEVVFLIIPSQEAEILRFRGGELDAIDDLKAADYTVLEAGQENGGYRLFDLGAGLDFNFLFFNLDPAEPASPEVAVKRKWFQRKGFRQAVSAAIDREGLARLVYQGRGTPIWSHVTPGNTAWYHHELERPARSLERSRELLTSSGFGWKDSALVDERGHAVAFTLITNANNAERVQMMTVIQEDLRQLGMKVQVVPLEMGTLIARVRESRDFDACVLGLGGGDGDPNPLMNVLLSSGSLHLWNPDQTEPASAWEAEIDRLMTEQATVLDSARRKALYDRVQELMAEELALVPLVSPNVLVGAKSHLGNFKPAVLHSRTLWNADELYWPER